MAERVRGRQKERMLTTTDTPTFSSPPLHDEQPPNITSQSQLTKQIRLQQEQQQQQQAEGAVPLSRRRLRPPSQQPKEWRRANLFAQAEPQHREPWTFWPGLRQPCSPTTTSSSILNWYSLIQQRQHQRRMKQTAQTAAATAASSRQPRTSVKVVRRRRLRPRPRRRASSGGPDRPACASRASFREPASGCSRAATGSS